MRKLPSTRRTTALLLTAAIVGALTVATASVADMVSPTLPAASAAPVPGGLGFTSLNTPCRAVDTRSGGGALGPDTTRSFQVGGAGNLAAQGGAAGGGQVQVPGGVRALHAHSQPRRRAGGTAQRKADVRENVPVLNSGRSGLQCESGDADDTYSQADSQPKKRASQPNHPAKYSSTRSVVQVAIPVPKKSASSVHTGQAIVMAQASTGQSSASRMAIRCSAAACNPE